MTGRAVAVVIPAYNASASISETLESVLAQTAPPEQIVVVDDGSTDGTTAVVSRYEPRVTLVRQRNAGQARARNAGAHATTAPWVAFLDADDVWLPTKLEQQMALASADVGLIYCDRFNIGDREGLPAVQSTIQPLVDGDVFESLLLENVITTSGVVVNRHVFDAVGQFSEESSDQPAEDWDLWLRMAAVAPVVACRLPLVKYRLQGSGASRKVERMNHARIQVVGRALASPRGQQLGPIVRRQVWSNTLATNAWDAVRHKRYWLGIRNDVAALAAWPFNPAPYLHLARTILGRA